MKKLLALALTVALLLSVVPVGVTASPEQKEAADSSNLAGSAVEIMLSWSAKMVLSTTTTKIGNYTVGTLFDMMVGKEDPNQQVIDQLDNIQNSITQLSRQNEQLKELVEQKSLWSQITSFLDWEDDVMNSFVTYYNTLRNIDERLAAGTITENQAAEERKEILCISLGDAQYMGSISTFDKEVIKFANYLRDEKQYDVNASGNLFDVHQEAMRYKYYWEHQAAEEMTVFREGALTTFMTMALVDRMSLMARIEKLEENGSPTGVLKNRLTEVNQAILDVANLKNATVQERPADERYYWKKGHEMLLKVAVQKTLPKENTKKGLNDVEQNHPTSTSIQGLTYTWRSYNAGSKKIKEFQIYKPFWKSFTNYSNSVQTISYDQLKTIYDDYGGKKTLYEIFFSEDEGAMPKIEGADPNWTFLIQADNDHPMFYQRNTWKADRVYMYGMTMSKITEKFPDASAIILAYYHSGHTDMSKNQNHYISIGYVNNSNADEVEDEIYTAVEDNIAEDQLRWTASDGDLDAPFGGIDGVEDFTLKIGDMSVPAANMTRVETEEGSIVTIDGEFLRQLPTGEYEIEGTFFYPTEEGTQVPVTIFYKLTILPPSIIQGDQVTVKEGVQESMTFVSDGRFEDFIGVELDGRTLDAQYYTVQEGSTVVTLNGEYVALLAAGEHTLNILSRNGTATATFTVEARTAIALPPVADRTTSYLWLWLLAAAALCGGGVLAVKYFKKK